MSHAVVLVVGDDVEGQLAAYDENREVERYKDRMDDADVKRMRDYYAEQGRCPADATPEQLVPLMEDWHGSEGGVDEDGLFCWSTYNPESKWDWYSVGGRWAGSLILRPQVTAPEPNVHVNPFSDELAAQEREHFAPVMDGRHADTAAKGEVDWEAMRLERLARVDKQWDGYEAKAAADGAEAAQQAAYWEFGLDPEHLEMGRTAHLAAEAARHPLSWIQAVVAEGVWREKGRLGWFGTSTDGPEERQQWDEWFAAFMAKMPDATTLTIVDYHI